MDDILQEFLVETHEGLDRLDRDLVLLEENPDAKEVLSQVFRTIHTIKGSSGFLALEKLGAIAHVGENLLSLVRDGQKPMSPQVTSALLAMADAIREILERLECDSTEGDGDYSPLIGLLGSLARKDREPGPVGAARPTDAGTETGAGEPAGARPSVAGSSIRVDVGLLDTLMNLVGELVLARNQILQHTNAQADPGLLGSCQRLDLVTTELQEGVMKTRMQPIGTIWSKYPRVVRDLGVACGKRVRIEMEGRDTELDKTIIESIKDPLMHALRNAVDHGVESAEQRRLAGKPEEGCVRLRAFHEGGQVNIEIADDGAGIDAAAVRERAVARGVVTAERAARMTDRELIALITLPGFSTAKEVTSVSGRGVGMDVVKTNIEKIGGSLDIQSVRGAGTTLRIKIPLTLAIIPALIVTSGGERFAIPQVNLLELVRLEGEQVAAAIEHVDRTPVYRLRGDLLPLVDLDVELGRADRGRGLLRQDDGVNIVVLRADDRQFGLVVEGILDTEEIVVKPLGRQLKNVPAFAGAAIMGDGRVALIVDVIGLAQTAGLAAATHTTERGQRAPQDAAGADRETLLLLATERGGRVAVGLDAVARLEEFDPARIEATAGQEVVQYRGEIMPLVRLGHVLDEPAGEPDADQRLQVVVLRGPAGRSVGLVVARVLDIVEEELQITRHTARPEVRGAAPLQGRVTDLLDVHAVVERRLPGFAHGAGTTLVGGKA